MGVVDILKYVLSVKVLKNYVTLRPAAKSFYLKHQ